MLEHKKDILKRIWEISLSIDVDPELFAAIVEAESDFDPWAVRYEPDFVHLYQPQYYAKIVGTSVSTEFVLQRCSWGLGQLMGGTARTLGFLGPLPSLCAEETGLVWAGKLLKKLAVQYKTAPETISAYNAGTARVKDGKFENQPYVDRIFEIMKKNKLQNGTESSQCGSE